MQILSIRHITTYHYTKPVAFGEHRLMLRPRNGGGQKVLKSEINITPAPLRLTWSQDIFGNHVAIARFDDRSDQLRFVNNIRLDHAPISFNEADIEESARFYPFAYAAEDRLELKRFRQPRAARNEIDRWSASFFREGRSVGTHEFLVGLTDAISRGFKHVSRHQKGVQDPVRTLELGSGSCRDLAVLMIAALRSRGFAARFVSGYVHLADDDDDDFVGGNMHAWVQVYVPGPGWVDFDPSSGVVGNQNLIRVAVAHHPREAIPL
jgi:transglutaminase-like putative cysteine protease